MSDGAIKVSQELIERYTRALGRASHWKTEWEDVRDYVRPNTGSFNADRGHGLPRTNRIFDSTAPWAMEQLASGLHAHLTDPTGRWFSLGIAGVPYNSLPFEVTAYLEAVTDRMFVELAHPMARWNQSAKEVFSDLSSYGTAIMFSNWSSQQKRVVYRSFNLSTCVIEESHTGIVDTVHRTFPMTKRQIEQEFPSAILSRHMETAKEDAEFDVAHSVFPNNEFDGSPITKKFYSTHFVPDEQIVLSEGGFDRFPYQVPRWSTMPGEIYGRGPAMTALPDIRLINLMNKELIQAAQLANRPPLVVDDDGFMLPISYKPASLIFRTPGTADPVALQGGGNFGITLELLVQKREQISKTFHVDWLLRSKKKERQSVMEINDDRGEMLRQLSSNTGRVESEFLSPSIQNLYFYLEREGQLPPAPQGLEGFPLEVVFTSPASKAQDAVKADAMSAYLAEMTPYAQVDPSIFDGIDMAQFGQEMAGYREVSRKILRSPQEIQQIQQDRANKEAQAQQTAQTSELAGALKDVATAGEKGFGPALGP